MLRGTDPEKEFLDKISFCKDIKELIVSGIVPDNKLFDKIN